MKILSLETSCDETSAAVLEGDLAKRKVSILANVVSSQIKIHEKYGGVVPNLAAREHVKNLPWVLKSALEQSQAELNEIDLFAVTQGPGLIPALLIGANSAKTLSWLFEKPLVGVHHIEGHVYANFVESEDNLKKRKTELEFPILVLTVSGGHTQLILMKDHLEYQIVGQTQDDAVGEAFDKVAKLLDLGYPGGPIVSRLADEARSEIGSEAETAEPDLPRPNFPRPMLSARNFDFSFSGLKTAVLYHWKKLLENHPELEKDSAALGKQRALVCQEFQAAAVEVLTAKTKKAAEKFAPRTVMLTGGVAANRALRESLERMIGENFPSANFVCPPLELCGDNAAMIGAAAFFRFLKYQKTETAKTWETNWKNLEANAQMRLG